MGYNMITKNGHNFFEMAAMLQNAIRRADYQRAGYAARSTGGISGGVFLSSARKTAMES